MKRNRKTPQPRPIIVRLELHPIVFDYVEELLLVGFFGHSREDIIELLCHRLRELERDGWCGTNNANARLGR